MNSRSTALVLSGGGSRGAYEIGVWQALKELDIRIDMVMGTSVGAINGAMIVQDDFEKALQLWKELETPMIFDIDIQTRQKIGHSLNLELGGLELDEMLAYAREIIKNGGAGNSGLKGILEEYIREDVLRSSPMEYGLVAVELPEFTPHYYYKDDIPKDSLIDYILASASCFPAVKSYELGGLQYIDGGYADNMPVSMASEKHARDIIAVDLEAIGMVKKSSLREATGLVTIQSDWDLGNFLIFNKENTRRIIRLGYLDAMKVFDIYDGGRFTFSKGTFDKKTLPLADAAAYVFELSPTCIYRKDVFDLRLNEAVQTQATRMSGEAVPDIFHNKPSQAFEAFSKTFNKKSLAIIIAKTLAQSSGHTPALLRKAKKVIGSEISAAQYLAQNGMVNSIEA